MERRKPHRERYWSDRDKSEYTCPDCGDGLEEVSRFEVHHIDGNAQNGDPENLIGLCKECHHDRHGDWIDSYTKEGNHRRDQRFVATR